MVNNLALLKSFPSILCLVVLFGCGAVKKTDTSNSVAYQFDFGGKAETKFVSVKPNTEYSNNRGYGFESVDGLEAVDRGIGNKLSDGFVTGNKPFLFSVKLPEGNYLVELMLGDTEGTSDAAVRVENRRMMINRVQTPNGQVKQVKFAVHVRDSLINGNNRGVRLKPREKQYLHWDDKLTFEINGENPKLASLKITPASQSVVTMFLAGNSTVVDQAEEPYAAWGQIIPAYFNENVAVANYAESGESLSSFISARRFDKMLSLMKAGDFAFVEFGHNDQKQSGPGIGAFTSYTKNLKYFITEVRKKGGKPVLVTSMQRRSFDSAGKIMHTLGDYPEAVRRVAKEENVPVIDLNAMSKTMYEAWGPERSIKAFVHFPANTFPNQKTELKDNTHFSPFGASQIAKIILEGIRSNVQELAPYIKAEVPVFNPAMPEDFNSFYWPYSPAVNSTKPDGN